MYPLGNQSGMGPQGYGANPTPAEQMHAAHTLDSTRQLMQWAAWNDPTVQAATRLTGDIITGGNYNRDSDYWQYRNMGQGTFNNTPLGQSVQTGAAMLALSSNAMGGSVAQMAQGIQQMMGNSGFSMGGGTFGGAGFVTDLTSKYMIDSIRDNFFSSTTGFSNNGLNKTDFGEVAMALGSRGAFRGMELGSMQHIGSGQEYQKYINSLKEDFPQMAKEAQRQLDSMGNNVGDIDLHVFNPNSDTFSKITEAFKGADKMISEFRDVFGNNAPASKMIREAENLVGMDITQSGAANAATVKLNALKTMAQANGMDMPQMLQIDQNLRLATASQMSAYYGGKPEDFARVAAATTLGTWNATNMASHSQSIMVREAAAQGRFLPIHSQDSIAAMNVTGVARIMGEETMALEALYMVDTMQGIEGENEIRSLVAELGNAPDERSRGRIRRELVRRMKDNGVSPGAMLRAAGGNPAQLTNGLSATSLGSYTEMLQGNEQSRIMDGTFKKMLNSTNLGARHGLDFKTGSASLGTFRGVLEAVGNELMTGQGDIMGLADILSGVNAGTMSWSDVTEFATTHEEAFKNAGFANAADVVTKLKAMDAQGASSTSGNYQGLGAAFNEAMTHMSISDEFVNRTTAASRIRADRSAVNQMLISGAYGNKRQGARSVLQNIISGVMGEGDISDSAILDYMESTKGSVSTFDIVDNALAIDADGARALDASMGKGLLKEFGVGSYEELSAILGTEAGTRKMMLKFKDPANKAVMDTLEMGKDKTTIRVGSGADAEEARKKLGRAQEASAALMLSGNSEAWKFKKIKELTDGNLSQEEFDKAIQQHQREAVDKIMGSTKELDKVAMEAAEGDSSRLRALTEGSAESKAAVLEMLHKRAAKLEDASDTPFIGSRHKKQLAATQEAIRQVSGSGDEYLGRIQLVLGDTLSGELFKKNTK